MQHYSTSEQELETGTTPGHASHLSTCSARTESKDGNAGGQAEWQSSGLAGALADKPAVSADDMRETRASKQE